MFGLGRRRPPGNPVIPSRLSAGQNTAIAATMVRERPSPEGDGWWSKTGAPPTLALQGDPLSRSQATGAVPGLGVGQLSRFRFYPRPFVREPHTELARFFAWPDAVSAMRKGLTRGQASSKPTVLSRCSLHIYTSTTGPLPLRLKREAILLLRLAQRTGNKPASRRHAPRSSWFGTGRV